MDKQPEEKKTPARLRHLKLAELVVRDGGRSSKGELVRRAGYSESAAKTPAKIFEAQGFKAALAAYGLTEELVAAALVEDIKMKPQRRVKELGLAADILGMRKSGGNLIVGNTVNVSDDRERFS